MKSSTAEKLIGFGTFQLVGVNVIWSVTYVASLPSPVTAHVRSSTTFAVGIVSMTTVNERIGPPSVTVNGPVSLNVKAAVSLSVIHTSAAPADTDGVRPP